jgi:PTH1 family peptidyl-tRNA hydrolase
VALGEPVCRALVAIDGSVILAAPETFMNRSGHAVRCLVERFGLEPERLLVVYDDVALPLGTLRLRQRGGPAGQKGMASVIESLRTDRISRLRLGIAPAAPGPHPGRIEFVLSRFDPDELKVAREQIERAADACELWLAAGAEAAMNRFNRADEPARGDDPAPTGA